MLKSKTGDDFPELELKPTGRSAMLLLLVCGLFVAIGIWMIVSQTGMGWLLTIFFGLGILVAIVQMLPGSSFLRINEQGITFASLYRKSSIPWRAIDYFVIVTLKQGRFFMVRQVVGFNHKPDYDRSKLGQQVATAVAGCDGALPDTYGKTAEELAELLTQYHERFSG